MVGGLVEDQELYWMGKYPSQRRPFSLPARERGHVVVDLGAYTKAAQGRFGFPPRADSIPHGAREELGHLLEKTHARTAAPTDLTVVRLVGPGQDAQKCRFSRAIYADHPDPFTLGDGERKPFEEHSADPADRHLFQID
jgi:hypothetical protein